LILEYSYNKTALSNDIKAIVGTYIDLKVTTLNFADLYFVFKKACNLF